MHLNNKKTSNRIATLILLLVCSLSSFGQLANIKENVYGLFWYLPSYSEKFDIRTKLHGSNNFSNIHESGPSKDPLDLLDAISANFESNKQLNALGFDNWLLVNFNKSGFPNQWVITSNYPADQVNKCLLQFEEIYNYLNKNSYKTTKGTTTDQDEKLIGRDYFFHSSQAMLTQLKAYISVGYSYNSYTKQYELDIHYYPEFLK